MVNQPSKRWSWFWRLTPWGRKALEELGETDQAIREVRDARLRECARYQEIARQSAVLQQAADENGFVQQLSQGFHPRTT